MKWIKDGDLTILDTPENSMFTVEIRKLREKKFLAKVKIMDAYASKIKYCVFAENTKSIREGKEIISKYLLNVSQCAFQCAFIIYKEAGKEG